MQLGWLSLVGLIAACGDPPGSFFVIEAASPMTFDQLEFFFGVPAGDRTPITPALIGTALPPERQQRASRLFADADAPARFDARASYTYFVPGVSKNLPLDYMLVIASRDGKPVAAAEVFEFEIVSSEPLHEYRVPLIPVTTDEVEVWGRNGVSCARWTHPRGTDAPTTVAVVRDDDSDCDGFRDQDPTDADCEPFIYCDGSGARGCVGFDSCFVGSSSRCEIGGCINQDGASRTCAAALCVDPAVCNTCGDNLDPPTIADCIVDFSIAHDDYLVPLRGPALCSEPYEVVVGLPFPCGNPAIESYSNYMPGGGSFSYDIRESGANECTITITPSVAGSQFVAVPHMVISVDSTPGAMPIRTAFLMGIEGDSSMSCPGERLNVVPYTAGCPL